MKKSIETQVIECIYDNVQCGDGVDQFTAEILNLIRLAGGTLSKEQKELLKNWKQCDKDFNQ